MATQDTIKKSFVVRQRRPRKINIITNTIYYYYSYNYYKNNKSIGAAVREFNELESGDNHVHLLSTLNTV